MSTAEEPATPFKHVVDRLEYDPELSSCSSEGIGSQMGGTPDNVSIDKITILIMLAHGLINLTPEAIRNQEQHPQIEHDSLPHVKNLAIFSFAPTGMVNIGNLQELSTISDIIQKELEKMIPSTVNLSLQSIEDKINSNQERLKSIKDKAPKRTDQGILTKICNICFRFTTAIVSLQTVVNYTFKGIFSVCKNILLPTEIFSSNGGALGLKRKRNNSNQTVSMSNDMCVLLFDDLRSSIQNFDRIRFPLICQGLKGKEFCDAALKYYEERCRYLYIVKGFGSHVMLPYVNKHFQYNTTLDLPLNMGVVKLKFSIDANGSVKSDRKLYDPRILMRQAGAYKDGDSLWSSMQDWIIQCTDSNDGTVCIVDLSCSGIVCQTPTLVKKLPGLESPGGGKIIKKKSYSRKKTRRNHHTKRIKNKSKHIKRVRNKRSIRKNNTKKLRK